MSTLTREQVLAMTAGPELDALIRIRVFGFADFAWVRGLPVFQTGDQIPPVSTDIAAAWEVVEHLSLRLVIGIESVKDDPDGDRWCVTVEKPSDPGWSWEVCDPTAPLAISRAALLTTLTEDQRE